MAKSGELVVPRVSGWLWLYDPPLYHWVALAFGSCSSSCSSSTPGARLASGAFMLAAFWLIYRAARDWVIDEDRARERLRRLLLLLGCVGLLVHAHEALPELATLAALCGAFAALPQPRDAPARRRASRSASRLARRLLVELDRARGTWPRGGRGAFRLRPSGARATALLSSASSSGSRSPSRARWPLALYHALAGALHAMVGARRRGRRAASAANLRYFLVTAAGSRGRRGRSRCGRCGRCAAASREPRLFVPFAASADHAGARSVSGGRRRT